MTRSPLLIALLAVSCFTGAQAATPAAPATLTATTAAAPEVSFDGLQRRESKTFTDLWVRKYFDVRSYRKVIFAPPHIEYRPIMKGDTSGQQAFSLTKRQKDSLNEIVTAAFKEELAKSQHFTLTDEPGLDVLTIRGDLVDVVSFVPANANGKNDPLTVPEVGEANLVLELYDSSSDAIMVRATEHVVAKHEPDTKTAAEAVKATALQWATILRERLDAAASIPLNP
ncbi:MAG TPA: DUF3313 family protein [Pseudomonadales bacterium]|nr:DUF3313 family protein [Pseudomonadales bacterium]